MEPQCTLVCQSQCTLVFLPYHDVPVYFSVIQDDDDFPVKTEVELITMETQPYVNVKPLEDCPELPKSGQNT